MCPSSVILRWLQPPKDRRTAGRSFAALRMTLSASSEQTFDHPVRLDPDILRRRGPGEPGIVMMSPARATTNPAPADGVTSRTVILNPVGRPSLVGSSEKEYWFLAMQTGVSPSPIDSRSWMLFSAV